MESPMARRKESEIVRVIRRKQRPPGVFGEERLLRPATCGPAMLKRKRSWDPP
jgi:hypothetical protein